MTANGSRVTSLDCGTLERRHGASTTTPTAGELSSTMSPVDMSDWTDREMKLAARIVRLVRKSRDHNEAINVIALVAKTVVETEPRRALYPWPQNVRGER